MKRILLDTSAYSAFMRGNQSILNAIRTSDEIVLNPVVLGELRSGFMRGKQNTKNQRELLSFLDSPKVCTVPIDDEAADRYAIILAALRDAGTPVPTNDIWIAATAMQHGLRVLTTDEHYLNIKQIVVDYFAIS
jgi:predicted nucleic acid-binding protein